MRELVMRGMEDADRIDRQFGLKRFETDWEGLSQERRDRLKAARERGTEVRRGQQAQESTDAKAI